MKKFLNKKTNSVVHFTLDDFNEDGNCINEIAKKIIAENSLIEITDKEADEIMNYKTAEQLAEEERLAKLPATEEQEKMKIELILINLLEQGGMI